MAKAMEKRDLTTLESDQIIGLAKGIESRQIAEVGREKLFVMVDKIEDKDVKELGKKHLSSMMGGMEGRQIKELKEDKRVSIVDNLDANFFGSKKAKFDEIRKSKETESKPAIKADRVGKTKIKTADKTSKFFSKTNLFKPEEN